MTHSALIVAVCAFVTALIRALPFLLYPGGQTPPRAVAAFSRLLPGAVMGMLVVYCLKDVTPLAYPYGIPEAAAAAVTVLSFVYKRNTAVSILLGTGTYMILLNLVF